MYKLVDSREKIPIFNCVQLVVTGALTGKTAIFIWQLLLYRLQMLPKCFCMKTAFLTVQRLAKETLVYIWEINIRKKLCLVTKSYSSCRSLDSPWKTKSCVTLRIRLREIGLMTINFLFRLSLSTLLETNAYLNTYFT